MPKGQRTFQLSSYKCKIAAGREHNGTAPRMTSTLINQVFHTMHVILCVNEKLLGMALLWWPPFMRACCWSCSVTSPHCCGLHVLLDLLCSQSTPSGVRCWEHMFPGPSVALCCFYYCSTKSVSISTHGSFFLFPSPQGRKARERAALYCLAIRPDNCF